MSTSCRSQSSASTSLPLFLTTLPKLEKSHEIFKLTNLCYTATIEPYWAHAVPQLGSCRRPPRCLLRGDDHLHRECPEKDKEDSTRPCCNCKLAEGEKPHPSAYRGCSQAKEMHQRKIPRAPKPNTGRAFSSKYIMSGVSFVEAIQSKADQTQQLQRQLQPQFRLHWNGRQQVSQYRLQ
jgi:hypothetical protein